LNILFKPACRDSWVRIRRDINEKEVVNVILNISLMVVCLIRPANDLNTSSNPPNTVRTTSDCLKTNTKSTTWASKLNRSK